MATEKSVIAVIRGARPSFKNDQDKVAFAVHASFLATGYMLTATGPAAMSDSALSSTSTDEVGIDGWNELDGEYGFVYLNPEVEGKRVLVKCLAMNDKLVVSALPADKGSKSAAEPVHLEISVNDYVVEDGGSNYSQQFKKLDKLISSLNTEVLSKLDGSHQSGSSSTSTSHPSDAARHVENEPRSGQPEPGNPQFHPSGVVVPPVAPFGYSDLYPGPGAGMYPSRGGVGGDGGMLLGPNDPRWFGGENQGLGFPGVQPGVPPGARFDPYGPPGIPGFEPGRFTRGPARPGRGGNMHPDLEQPGNGFDYI
ncbi:Probable proteasome inhibitor [Linum perenne]